MGTHYTPGNKRRVDADPIEARTPGSVSFLQKLKPFVLASILLIVGSLIALAVVVIVGIPVTNTDALEHSGYYMELHDTTYDWESPYLSPEKNSFELHISQEEYIASFDDDRVRLSTSLIDCPTNMLDPGDPYVVQIADMLLKMTEGMDEWTRATVALNLVQTIVDYTHDDVLYGVDDFWATPLETLYLKKGDCEDTSILLCSIYLAMGMDAVLIDLPHHVAVGIYVEGVDGCLYCETVSSRPTEIDSYWPYWPQDEIVICSPDDAEGFPELVIGFLGSYRNFIQDVTGI